MGIIQQWDQGILDFVQQYMHTSFFDRLMPIVTSLGDGGMIWIIVTIVLLLTKKYRSVGIASFIGLIICVVVVNLGLKPLVARTRPFDVNPEINLLIAKPHDFSFPSGHTATAFVVATILWRVNRSIGFWAFVLAGAIAFSRIYLYVHYPSDVFVGAIIGVVIGLAVVEWGKRRGYQLHFNRGQQNH